MVHCQLVDLQTLCPTRGKERRRCLNSNFNHPVLVHVQLQLTRKHDAEVSKLRKEVDESNTEHELLAQSLRRKHQDAVAEMGDQIDHLTKLKAK